MKKEEPIIQLPFTSEAFKESWNEWQQHCREKKKTITPTSMNRQFKKFLGWGEGRSIAAISLSVESNWQGIFESSATTSKKSNPLKADDYKL